ncbi:MAG: 4-coumarate--CoA ligase family protein [Chloroflexi bacterium]|nr:4-coumarate--CoA ligase family protein [Chloroflexota bacterium]
MGVYRSPWPDVQIPEMSLPELALQNVARYADKPALIDGPSGRVVTYQQLATMADRFAAGMAARGLQPGDVFAIFSPNLPEYPAVFHGVLKAGGIVTTANPLYTAQELHHQLVDSGAKYIITIPPFIERVKEAIQGTGVKEIFVFGEAEGATSLAEVLKTDAPLPQVTINPAEDIAVLPYSSGTTGLPKGVMLTHRNLVANIVQAAAIEGVTDQDVLIGVLPFYHIYGMTVILNYALYRGSTVITMPRFDLETFLKLIETYRITRMHLVPPIILALAKHPLVEKYDLSSVKYIVSGAAPLAPEVAKAAAARLDCVVKQGYGLTESSPVTNLNPDDPAKIKLASVGPLVPNTEARVVDVSTGKDVAPGELGEIWIRGPQVMKGYLNKPEATAKTLDAEGWLHTGDVGYVDEDGYFYIVDRIKELIKYKGYQVAPAELEAILLSHPAVADAAVIPSPDPEAGEVPKAFVVKKADVTADELMAYVAERVAPYKKIRRLEFVDQIPKSPSGKILRRVLVEQERKKMAGQA